MKKIVICIPTLSTAGAERFVVDLAINLDKSKYCVYVAITHSNIVGKFGKILKENNVDIVNLTGKNYFECTKKQILFFKKIKPDVIHANIGSMFHVMLSAKIMRIEKKIYTIHNEANLLYGNSKLRKLVYRLAFNFFDFLPVAICESVKVSMEREFGKKYASIPCVNNGVDIMKYCVSKRKNTTNTITFINTGTMYWIKNQNEIIEAFSNLFIKYKNIRLIILGDGENRKKLEKLIKIKEISDVVNMPGICTNVSEYLQSSDIYISASLTEGLPLSMLEAMACGLPVIGSDAGGTVDLIKPDINGFIYPKKNRKSLEKAMEKLINNTQMRVEYAKNSRKIAENWSIEKCVLGYENLYNS